MPNRYFPFYFFSHFLKKESNQFFTSIAIRYLAIGMVLIFEPIYIYHFFNDSISLTLLFFAVTQGFYAVFLPFAGKIMSKLGFDKSILFSHFFFFGYYISLFYIYSSFMLIPLAIFFNVMGRLFFWPSFHTDFTRFSKEENRGKDVSKKNLSVMVPAIIGPFIGGWVIAEYGYPTLFISVLLLLLASAIPLFLGKRNYEVYTDTYVSAWRRVFKKKNRKTTLALASAGMETSVNVYIWPIFMSILAITYFSMGGITSFALFVSAAFTYYIGRLVDLAKREKLLVVGSVMTSVSWILKYFVFNPFTAFLAHSIYRLFRTSASIPFQAIFYQEASSQKDEADEFIVYREITLNFFRFLFLTFLAVAFLFIKKVNIAFLLAAALSFGFMFFNDEARKEDRQRRNKK